MSKTSYIEQGSNPMIGVGLRHPHYTLAVEEKAAIDFVEVHSENFFTQGGALSAYIEQVSEMYPISLHSTALGLGSAERIPEVQLAKLNALSQRVKPFLLSDHASFSWSRQGNSVVHAGDLLPLSFNQQSLEVLAANVDQVQQYLGKQFLIENLSAYLQLPEQSMSETEFLVALTDMTQCGLLIDLNNIIVTAINQQEKDPLAFAKSWLSQIPVNVVKEIHLAGFTPVPAGELVVDDHSQAVSEQCWELYQYAIHCFGNIPTLIEWDNNIPSWQTLLDEANKARAIAFQHQQTKEIA